MKTTNLSSTCKEWQRYNESARSQLKVSDDYEIIMMSSDIKYFDKDSWIVEFSNSISLFADEVLEEVEHHLHNIKLPTNHMLVAMQTLKDPDNIVYGIIIINHENHKSTKK
jgi:hypothetical protein